MNTTIENFICAQCDELYNKGWSDEEAKAEATVRFSGVSDLVLVCDDCYKEIMQGIAYVN